MAMITSAPAAPQASICAPAMHPLPMIWPGYVMAVVLLVVDFGEAIFDPSRADDISSPLWILSNIAFIAYWMFCIYQVHVVLREVSAGLYPISPGKALGFHFIPFFNLYWIFRWTSAVADFVNANSTVRMTRVWPGLGLLAGAIVTRFAGELGCAIDFTVMLYIVRKIGKALPP
jgi:hypothetical protein